MKSKTLIDKQMKRKTSSELIETIKKAKKKNNWLEVAGLLSSPKRISVNLKEIEKKSEEGDTILIPGKVLSEGEISKKIRIAAMNFSGKAGKKLKGKNCKLVSILEEIKENPDAKGIKILK